MSIADLAIVAALVFGWGTLSARLERFDVTAPITFVLAGLLLTHGPLAVLGFTPSDELIKTLAEFTLALVLFSDASRVGLHELLIGTDAIKKNVQEHARVSEMFATAVEEGMRTLKQDGIEKVLTGVTDIHQVRSVCIK